MNQIHNNMTLADCKRRVLQRDGIEKRFVHLVSQLSRCKRLFFALYYIHGYTTEEIASLCNIDPTTVSRRLKRIIREVDGDVTNKSSWHKNERSLKR